MKNPIYVGTIPDVVLYRTNVHHDLRGHFREAYSGSTDAVQDNVSVSCKNVLRGIHMNPVGYKFVQCLYGRIMDVLVDLREGPTYGLHEKFSLTGLNGMQLYVPPGVGHSFIVKSDTAVVFYKTNTYYNNPAEINFKWNQFGIDWECENPILSEKDK
jgi:dTDP-4-dehydrorhamnose 3,5-epimerase